MASENCICQRIFEMSNADIDAMRSDGLVDYEHQLRTQQGCKYLSALKAEVERCQQRLVERAGRDDPVALHWKLNIELSQKQGKKCQKI